MPVFADGDCTSLGNQGNLGDAVQSLGILFSTEVLSLSAPFWVIAPKNPALCNAESADSLRSCRTCDPIRPRNRLLDFLWPGIPSGVPQRLGN